MVDEVAFTKKIAESILSHFDKAHVTAKCC